MANRAAHPNFDGASRHESGKRNLHLEQALRTLHQRLEVLERGTGTQGLDSDKQQKLAPTPPRAGLGVVSSSDGTQMAVAIANPEFQQRKGGNPLRTPIYHRVEYSEDPTFRTGVTRLPHSTQTYFPLPVKPGAKLHFRLQSSYDGRNFNAPVLSGPVKK